MHSSWALLLLQWLLDTVQRAFISYVCRNQASCERMAKQLLATSTRPLYISLYELQWIVADFSGVWMLSVSVLAQNKAGKRQMLTIAVRFCENLQMCTQSNHSKRDGLSCTFNIGNLQAALPLQQLHKYSSIVLFAHLHSHRLLRSFTYSFAMNNVKHLMSDGKIIVSQCWPNISCSAQFTIGHSVISQPLHASHCWPVRGWFAEKHPLALHRHTPTQISVDLTAGMLLISPD